MVAEGSTGRASSHEEMKGYLQGFPGDLAQSVSSAREWVAELTRRGLGERSTSGRAGGASHRPQALALSGLGGSAVGGDLARAILRPAAALPFEVLRDYELPGWVSAQAFLIASSYSGNTEETLAAYAEAVERGVPACVVTSGGALATLADSAGSPVFRLPPGLPPRAALGHSLPPVLLAAALVAGLDVESYAAALEGAAQRLKGWGAAWSLEDGENPARELAGRLAAEIPVFYASVGLYEPAAVRWRAQLAENAKMLSFHHLLPEMDHNEIVGWQENAGLLRRCRVVFLTGSHEHPRVSRRIEITAEIIGPVAGGVEVVRAPEGTPVEELLGLVLLGDYVSLFAAAAHGVEPVPVDRISVLKGALQDAPA